MELYIKAPQDFEDFLKNHGIQYSIMNTSTTKDVIEFNADYSIKEKILISVVASLITSGIKELGNLFIDYIKTTKQEIVVTTDNEKYVINQNNVNEITPIIYKDFMTALNEENNGKNR